MIIGIKYGHMHIGFTYPSVMRAFKQHCIELIGEKNEAYKNFIKFLWGIKVHNFDSLRREIESMITVLKESCDLYLSEKSLSFLDEEEKENYRKLNNNIFKFFTTVNSSWFFLDLFIDEIENAKKDDEEYISIGTMAIRPDMVDEYGWDYPTKIPDEIRNLGSGLE